MKAAHKVGGQSSTCMRTCLSKSKISVVIQNTMQTIPNRGILHFSRLLIQMIKDKSAKLRNDNPNTHSSQSSKPKVTQRDSAGNLFPLLFIIVGSLIVPNE
ncbi:hypothetical protein HHI36_024012 [Cryptolaemus montrouzieri]|uniref:Uncharacterized protein n=1 Tax=Cryptolaemus montrouzieri TaxID=559131 RepID=A0ABD2N036_9CUCU